MLASKRHINRIVAIVACTFVWQANAYIHFATEIDDDAGNAITSDPTTPQPANTNRFTSSLMSLFGLTGMPSNSRGPIHDTPPLPCRCRK